MIPFRYREFGVLQPNVAGGAMDLDVQPIAYRSTYEQIVGVTDFSSPLPCINVVFVEGVDYPFFTRFASALEPPTWLYRKAAQAKIWASMQSLDGLGTAPTITSIPPDVNCLFTAKVFDLPDAWASVRTKARYVALRATSDAPGEWAEKLPATSYNDYSCRLLSEIQRHLLENSIDGGLTWQLWDRAEVLGYVNQRLYRFLVETGLLRSRITMTVAAGTTSVDIPADSIEIRRVAWNNSALVRSNAHVSDNAFVGWEATPGTPYSYFESPVPTQTLRLVPTPNVSGTLDILYVPAIEAVTSTCAPLPLPSSFILVIKYGIMADMLAKEGEANDPERVEYCLQRWEMGVEIAKLLLGTDN